MALRLISCPDCGHRMRVGARHCGRCHAESPVVNRAGFLTALGLIVLALAAAVAAFRAGLFPVGG